MHRSVARLAYYFLLLIAAALYITALASRCAPIAHYPLRQCLYDSIQRDRFRVGTATMQRSDGAILFRFDDQAQGDKGTYWFVPEQPGSLVDVHGRLMAPCGAASSDPWGRP